VSHPLRVGLQEHLSEWTDWDVAAHVLGQSIGVFEEGSAMSDHKAVFWSDNQLGNGLHDALLGLVRAGVLARREEPDEQFRWVR
jgi:hypothetical protein